MSLELITQPNNYYCYVNGTINGSTIPAANPITSNLMGTATTGAFVNAGPAVFSLTYSKITNSNVILLSL